MNRRPRSISYAKLSIFSVAGRYGHSTSRRYFEGRCERQLHRPAHPVARVGVHDRVNMGKPRKLNEVDFINAA